MDARAAASINFLAGAGLAQVDIPPPPQHKQNTAVRIRDMESAHLHVDLEEGDARALGGGSEHGYWQRLPGRRERCRGAAGAAKRRQQARWTCEHAALSQWHRWLTCIEPPPAPAAGVLTEATAPSATWTGVCILSFLTRTGVA
jgi:hypothetical protein